MKFLRLMITSAGIKLKISVKHSAGYRHNQTKNRRETLKNILITNAL